MTFAGQRPLSNAKSVSPNRFIRLLKLSGTAVAKYGLFQATFVTVLYSETYCTCRLKTDMFSNNKKEKEKREKKKKEKKKKEKEKRKKKKKKEERMNKCW